MVSSERQFTLAQPTSGAVRLAVGPLAEAPPPMLDQANFFYPIG